jgi:N utilization substance protein B
VLLDMYRFLLNQENFESLVEDAFPLWTDDRSLIVGSMKKTIKGLPVDENFTDEYRPAFETVTEFGESLLAKTLETDTELLGMIEPVLKNWDADRVAIIDMILIKMALSELITFPTIPTKVTLNEYLDISKLYSTDKSKEFVNGILDRLMKKLQEEGLIQKEGRGLED